MVKKTRKNTRTRRNVKRGGGWGSGGWQFQPATPGTPPAPPIPPPRPASATRRNRK